jgi:uncharacterized HhH-GPD family protein
MAGKPSLHLAQDESADALLSSDPFALLVGMLLDQQFPMERAFAGPSILAERLGTPDRLDPATVLATDPQTLADLSSTPPAIHRYPGSMAGRIQAVAKVIVEEYGGQTQTLWETAPDGATVYARLKALPGFGEQKAKIFTALLGKQLGVQPPGWEAAAGVYAEPGSRRSIADVRDPGTLTEVRAFKQEAKRRLQ